MSATRLSFPVPSEISTYSSRDLSTSDLMRSGNIIPQSQPITRQFHRADEYLTPGDIIFDGYRAPWKILAILDSHMNLDSRRPRLITRVVAEPAHMEVA